MTMLTDWLNYKEQLRHYVLNNIDDVDAVDDILQEVYIKASGHLQQLKSQDSLKSWLYRITHNVIMDFYRSREIYDELSDALIDDVEEEQALDKMAQCLRPMFDCLPEKYQMAMIWSEVEGLPQQEVADRLGISLSGAKSRIQRGRVKFKSVLMTYCDIEIDQQGAVDFKPKIECRHLAC
ncbi:RNA polymerase sigma factor SigZ [Shewanella sairae]|uniref:RNA polymerase sigma factor SigZ n=2 Tax=Shewanella sairae TaxID=190310 RepID=A0ABQ4PA25_9GAMM|nr:RNA polymerase sigma factor SigZ [Shewanella sairae]MCL1132281.1 RNA polymerase sigma factor SigZ [Shewanella sairae]GIU44326.1 RNA polymerase sigma factor SigZ [Shewanella sairae]